MRLVLFVTCFTLGVSLMVLSGFVPQSASARGEPGDTETAKATSDSAQVIRSPSRAWVYHPDTDGAPGAAAEPGGAPESAAAAPVPDTQSAAAPEAGPQPADIGTALTELVASATTPEATEPAGDEPQRDPSDGRRRRSGNGAASDGSEAAAESPADAPPVADAGQNRAVWSGAGGVLLDGSKSSGEGLTYAWRQTSGPASLTIDDPAQPVIWAGGLSGGQGTTGLPATYEFELVVSDSAGRQAAHSVQIVAQAAPELESDPPAELRFEERDGYVYGVFEAWATNQQTGQFTFTITSPQRLKFTALGGDAYDLAGRRARGVCVYQVTLYLVPGQATSLVELLAETNEKVPGVVRLGVNWHEAAAAPAAEREYPR